MVGENVVGNGKCTQAREQGGLPAVCKDVEREKLELECQKEVTWGSTQGRLAPPQRSEPKRGYEGAVTDLRKTRVQGGETVV